MPMAVACIFKIFFYVQCAFKLAFPHSLGRKDSFELLRNERGPRNYRAFEMQINKRIFKLVAIMKRGQ